MTLKRIYRNARILLGDHSLVDGVLVTEGDRIAYIGAEQEGAPACDEVVDVKNGVIVPGFVNTHGHSAMTLLRGTGDGLPLDRWLNEAIFPIEAKMTPEDIRAGMTWAVVEMLRGGTTCVADMYDFPEAGAEALLAAGFKANICRVGLDFPWAENTPPGRLGECIDFVRNFRDPTGRVVADFCLHSEYLTREPFVRAVAEANADFRRPVHLHVSETAKEHAECAARHGGLTPIAYFAGTGLLDHGAYCAHCVHCTDADFALMRAKGATLASNPTSNMKLGSGFARVPAARAAGVNVSLGTDGCASNDNLDMFEEMHLMALVHRGLAQDPTCLQAGDVLDMATVNGARALGRTDTGVLEAGKKADFCVVSFDAPHLYPAFDVPALLVFSAQMSDVTMTVVDGEILYDHGEYPTIDVDRARFEFSRAVRRLRGRC